MSDKNNSVSLLEWETKSPANCTQLSNLNLDDSADGRHVAALLNESQKLQIVELRNGLEISSFSHVGRVRVGKLTITVLPKLKGISLLRLLRYAFGFRRLKLMNDSTHIIEECGFEDLLVHQLIAESQELISRGLQRAYVRRDEQLTSPRGRINIDRLALNGGMVHAALPCQHFPRLEDTLLNRVLMAGLQLAGEIASVLTLRREARRVASSMEEQVSRINLSLVTLEHASSQLTRLTRAYAPSLSIIRLLLESKGVVLEGRPSQSMLPGFLFDMNAFFQALLSRFLRDHLVNCTVHDEFGLRGMLRYNPQFNPQQRRSFAPRPDYAIKRHGDLVSLLDAKYRDLWENALPREMLYQLVIYAIGHRERLQSSILYPAADPLAKESRIDVIDSVHGRQMGQVCLRPVNLAYVEELVATNSLAARRAREAYARKLAFGVEAV